MKVFRKALLATLIMASASNVFAADTADLTVTGVIKPVACTPSFVGGGNVDFGNISPTKLSSTSHTKLGLRSVNYTITCDAPIAMATRFVDARAGTGWTTGADKLSFGLGKSGKGWIGGYILQQKNNDLLVDGKAASIIHSGDKGASWVADGDVNHVIDGSTLVSFAPSGTLIPGAYKTVAGKLQLETMIAPTSQLDLSSDIRLDGLATMEVVYL